jgi:hypothetical protein
MLRLSHETCCLYASIFYMIVWDCWCHIWRKRDMVEHVGLPRLDDFCWFAAQETNVYAGLSVASAFVHLRPRYFGEILANLLFWLGPDKICFGSDYAIWSPKWIIEKFMVYDFPDDLKREYHVVLTPEVKRKILGENSARLYGIISRRRRRRFVTTRSALCSRQLNWFGDRAASAEAFWRREGHEKAVRWLPP